MAQITVVYKDFEEMKAVARELLKDELKESQGVAGQRPAAPVTPPAPVPPAPAAAPAAPTAPTQNAPTAPAPPAVPTSAPSYTRDDLSRAAMTLMDKGMQAQLQQLIQSYGVNSLVELPQDQYGNFATALRGMGAQI